MKLVFMGTPEFAVPSLRRLCAEGFSPVVVYTQPDRPSGRGRRPQPPPVASEAVGQGLQLRQPETLQDRSEMSWLAELQPDLIVTAAYGKIFRRRLLDLPRLGCINLHPSLLPRYRGLSPIQWAILRGDRETGVTVYRMTTEVDAGPVLAQLVEPVRPDDTAGSLGRRLAILGADAIVRTVRDLATGQLPGRAQDEELASFAPRLERHHGQIDWRLPAAQLDRLVRAMDPWPGTYCFVNGLRVKILEIAVKDEVQRSEPPGTLLDVPANAPPIVAALPGAVALSRVQPENGRAQDGAEFARGRRLKVGGRLRPRPVE